MLFNHKGYPMRHNLKAFAKHFIFLQFMYKHLLFLIKMEIIDALVNASPHMPFVLESSNFAGEFGLVSTLNEESTPAHLSFVSWSRRSDMNLKVIKNWYLNINPVEKLLTISQLAKLLSDISNLIIKVKKLFLRQIFVCIIVTIAKKCHSILPTIL